MNARELATNALAQHSHPWYALEWMVGNVRLANETDWKILDDAIGIVRNEMNEAQREAFDCGALLTEYEAMTRVALLRSTRPYTMERAA